ncbi:hypothetical protein D3C78_1140390 [compost metagenome]
MPAASASMSAGRGTRRIALLQGVGHVENDRQVLARTLHHAKAQHVHYQVVITQAGATVAQDQLVVTGFLELVHDVLHLRRAQELRLLDVHRLAGLGQGHHQVSLARQERRQLQYVGHFGNGSRLINLVHVGNHRNTELSLHRFENPQAFFHARTAIGVNRGTVGLVEARLEHIRNAQLLGDTHVLGAGGQGQVQGFKDVDAAEEDEGGVVGAGDIVVDFDHGTWTLVVSKAELKVN